MNTKKASRMAGGIGNEVYEASVIARAVDRAGHCPQLKGHVHEIMFCDKYNLANTFNGNTAQLTKSTTAPMKDIIVKNSSGRIAMHGQLKDTISNNGVRKTANQIIKGKYNKTTVYGTEETTREVNRVLDAAGKTNQRVQSTGISSKTTSRIASKGLGQMPTLATLGNAAKAGGFAGAAISGGIEAATSIYDVVNGDKEWDDAVIDVAGATAKGGIAGAGSAVAGSLAAGATGTAVTAIASTSIGGAIVGTTGGALLIGAAPVVASIGAAFLVGSAITSFFES
ncbi:hypothetical protein [Selenomonas ruminis]|uniref:Uncharacterized protein n=1 Tax=Selenomonas ruminis TaxID=2593411 RepID=A0A5D6W7I8_9FIRM|nr:hypothetical protein [Selenomonas sp. mPRGC5]TYZ22919.1 hypothetical protein FZ040_06790 [Selenomonas sp. mPRGC5]